MFEVLQSRSSITPSFAPSPAALPPSRNANRPASGLDRVQTPVVPNTKFAMPATGSLTIWSSKSNDQ